MLLPPICGEWLQDLHYGSFESHTVTGVGFLDEEARRLDEEEAARALAAIQQADERRRRLSEGQDLAREFMDRARAAGLRPTFELKYEMHESRPIHAATRYYNNSTQQFSEGRPYKWSWSEPTETRREHFAWVWSLGSSEIWRRDAYFLSSDGRRYIPGRDLELVSEEGDLITRKGRKTGRRILRRPWKETDVHSSDSLWTDDTDPNSYGGTSVSLSEAMVRYLRRASRLA